MRYDIFFKYYITGISTHQCEILQIISIMTGITLLLKVVMEYTSDKYEVTFEYYNGDDKDNKQSVTETWDIGNYFDKHGNVHVYGIETAVINMHKKIVKSKIKKTQ